MSTLVRRLRVLRRLLGDRVGFAAFLFVLMLLAAFAETVGVSMVLPLVSTLADIPVGAGRLAEALEAFRAAMPDGFEIEALLAILAVAFLCKGLLLTATHALTDHFVLTLRDGWSTRLLEHFLTARYETMAREKHGALIHDLTVEPYRAARGMAMLLNVLNRLIMTAVLMGVLLLTSWQATLAVASGGALFFYVVRTWSYRYALRFGRLHQDLHQEVNALSGEAISGGLEVRLFGAVERISAQVAARLARHSRAEAIFRAVREGPVQTTEFVVIAVLVVALLILKDVMGLEPASFAASLAFFGFVSQRLLTNFMSLLTLRMKLVSYVPSMQLVDATLQNAPVRELTHVGATFTGLDGDIVFRGVTFAYEPGRDVVRGLNLTIAKGRTTALIGASGIGKSTVADMLLGLVSPQAGSIRLGSRPLADFSLASLRLGVGYVSQDPMIFHTTVRENIAFGMPGASLDEVRAAARAARADAFIERLPQGYDTIVGDRGATLSGGERQRVAVARVILRRPAVYVFDEATSALDPESEALVRDSMRVLATDATVLIIAHRPSAVAGADVIYRLGADGVRQVGLAGVGT
jgi:ABC-type multidrug transport system fused ATPase/permease subunit